MQADFKDFFIAESLEKWSLRCHLPRIAQGVKKIIRSCNHVSGCNLYQWLILTLSTDVCKHTWPTRDRGTWDSINLWKGKPQRSGSVCSIPVLMRSSWLNVPQGCGSQGEATMVPGTPHPAEGRCTVTSEATGVGCWGRRQHIFCCGAKFGGLGLRFLFLLSFNAIVCGKKE